MPALDQQLLGTWMHSREEDTATEQVYRPAGYDFPPARGRRGFELLPDSVCRRIGIAAADGPSREACTWRLAPGAAGTRPVLTLSHARGQEETLAIVSLDKERLVVEKPH